ncbi:MAG: hypothetical protein WD875_12490 [Pirellulales bacterium]
MLRRTAHFWPVALASLTLGLIVATASGCKSWGRWGSWDDDGFSEEDQKLTENVRPREANSSTTSVSTKGRQIEHNLGIGDK